MRISTLTCIVIATLFAACSGEEAPSDGYGNFEAVEVTISSEAAGRILAFTPQEGMQLAVGEAVGLVDTLALSLQKAQLAAGRRAVRSRFPGIAAQAEVVRKQIDVAETERARFRDLVAQDAATQKQLDDIAGQIAVLRRQLEAVRAGNAPVFAELDVFDARIAVLEDQLSRAEIVNPVGGTVLETYVEAQEMTAPGRPLYTIADLHRLELRAFISGAQLPALQIGQSVSVIVDGASGGLEQHTGEVSWISSQAEFTPQLIQTREQRVSLVYAIKVRVDNPDGVFKIGMPGEVVFDQ